MQDKKTKIHCINIYDNPFTYCGKVSRLVICTGGWIFDRLREEYKCKKCKNSKKK